MDACPESKYFAIQDRDQCFCGSSLSDATQYGEVPFTECGFNGAAWCNFLYENNNIPTPLTVTTPPTCDTTTEYCSHHIISGGWKECTVTDPPTCNNQIYCLENSKTEKNGTKVGNGYWYGSVIGVTCCDTNGAGFRNSSLSVTYEGAKAHCATMSSEPLSLCTVAQLKAGAGFDGGYEFNDAMMWTSDPCGSGPPASAPSPGGPTEHQCPFWTTIFWMKCLRQQLRNEKKTAAWVVLNSKFLKVKDLSSGLNGLLIA